MIVLKDYHSQHPTRELLERKPSLPGAQKLPQGKLTIVIHSPSA
jgi:hypothetical protein